MTGATQEESEAKIEAERREMENYYLVVYREYHILETFPHRTKELKNTTVEHFEHFEKAREHAKDYAKKDRYEAEVCLVSDYFTGE